MSGIFIYEDRVEGRWCKEGKERKDEERVGSASLTIREHRRTIAMIVYGRKREVER